MADFAGELIVDTENALAAVSDAFPAVIFHHRGRHFLVRCIVQRIKAKD